MISLKHGGTQNEVFGGEMRVQDTPFVVIRWKFYEYLLLELGMRDEDA